jgi:hypothetical protein
MTEMLGKLAVLLLAFGIGMPVCVIVIGAYFRLTVWLYDHAMRYVERVLGWLT